MPLRTHRGEQLMDTIEQDIEQKLEDSITLIVENKRLKRKVETLQADVALYRARVDILHLRLANERRRKSDPPSRESLPW